MSAKPGGATARRLHCGLLVMALLLISACGMGDDSSSEGPAPTFRTTIPSATTTTLPLPCRPEATTCAASDVIATLIRLYEAGDASHDEAACLARATGIGARSLAQALAPSEKEIRDAVACVGSEARLGEIGKALTEYLSGLPRPEPDRSAAIQCTSVRDAARAASAVFYANQNRWATTFTELTSGPDAPLDLSGQELTSPTTVSGEGWTLTMSSAGTGGPSFVCRNAS